MENVCKALKVDTPSETHLLEIRVSMEKFVVCYLKGETEIEDFYHLCAGIAIDDDDFRHCVQYLAQVSDPLARFIAEVRSIPYETVATANMYKPGCKSPVDVELHRFGGGKMTILDDDAAVEDFGSCIADAAHFVAYYHRGSSEADLLVFRFQWCTFFYFHRHSRRVRSKVVKLLSREVMDKYSFSKET